MGEIRPIQTRYDGCHFRSRLEARWAVFFNALRIEYRYEPEGFDLGDAGLYLPDFYIPSLKKWIEVKGDGVYQDAVRKCYGLCAATEKKVVLLNGEPWPDNYEAILFKPLPNEPNQVGLMMDMQFGIGKRTGALFVVDRHNTECETKGGNIRDAFTAARSARFEHGESQKRKVPDAPVPATGGYLEKMRRVEAELKRKQAGPAPWEIDAPPPLSVGDKPAAAGADLDELFPTAKDTRSLGKRAFGPRVPKPESLFDADEQRKPDELIHEIAELFGGRIIDEDEKG